MAKKSGQKRKKEEKAKTQLKKPKTGPGNHLPKGTNVTKTEFKVGKIVIPKQLEKTSDTGPVTKKKLGLKELLAKLNHFSQSVRTEGLEGMKELVTGELGGNLVDDHFPLLVTKLAPLTSDREAKVRKSAFAILQAVLSKTDEGRLEPLFPVLTAHVSCCLTHIDPSIQQDGLNLVDSLVNAVPTFIARNYARILPDCMEQISARKSGGGASEVGVSTEVSQKTSSLQWRTNVLQRVDAVLGTVIDNLAASDRQCQEGRCFKQLWTENLHCPVYPRQDSHLSLADLGNKSKEDPMLEIVDRLLPLILESWIEATPESKKRRNSFVSNEVFGLFEHIARILDKLVAYCEQTGEQSEYSPLVSQLRSRYYQDLHTRLMAGLPYSNSSGRCNIQNILLCNVILSLADSVDSDTLAKVMSVADSPNVPPENKLKVLRKLLHRELDMDNKQASVEQLLEMSSDTSGGGCAHRSSAIRLLSVIAESDEDLNDWLASLPARTVAAKEGEERTLLLQTMLKFAKRHSGPLKKAFIDNMENLHGWTSQLSEEERTSALEILNHIQLHFH